MIGIKSANVAYDLEERETFIIRVNHALDFSSTMKNAILCTNQAFANGLKSMTIPQYSSLMTLLPNPYIFLMKIFI